MTMQVPFPSPRPSFEIRIAVVGARGCGKSTLLDALFKEKLVHGNIAVDSIVVDRFRATSIESWRTLKLTEDGELSNTPLNKNVEDELHGIRIQEHIVCLEECGFESTKNIDLIFEEIPGCCIDYMKSSWYDIDCLIFVADLKRSSYSSEDESLFNAVDELMKTRQVPLLIIGNKFDSIQDEPTIQRAEHVKQILETMTVSAKRPKRPGPQNGGEEEEEEEKKEDGSATTMYTSEECSITPPAFVSLSSKQAMWCRYAATLKKESLSKHMDMVEEILIRSLGDLQTLGMDDDKRLETLWTKFHGEEEEEEPEEENPPLSEILRVSSVQFDRLLDWLRNTLCNEESQRTILQRQQEHRLKTLKPDNLDIVARLRHVHFSPCQVRGGVSESLVATFWALYHACEDKALADFHVTMNARVFDTPLRHLCQYMGLLQETRWESMIVVVSALQSLLRSQIKIIIQKHQVWSIEKWYKKRDRARWERKTGDVTCWKYLSPVDWTNIYGSVLLVVNDRYICTRMGKEKIMLETLYQKSHDAMLTIERQTMDSPAGNSSSRSIGNKVARVLYPKSRDGKTEISRESPKVPFRASDGCPSLQRCMDGYYSLKSGKFVPKYLKTHSCVVRVDTPSSLDDPSHFGHVAYVYRKVLASIGKK